MTTITANYGKKYINNDGIDMGDTINLGYIWINGIKTLDSEDNYTQIDKTDEEIMEDWDGQDLKNELLTYCITNGINLKGFVGDMSEFLNNGTAVSFAGVNIYLAERLAEEDITEDNLTEVEAIFLTYGIDLNNYK